MQLNAEAEAGGFEVKLKKKWHCEVDSCQNQHGYYFINEDNTHFAIYPSLHFPNWVNMIRIGRCSVEYPGMKILDALKVYDVMNS